MFFNYFLCIFGLNYVNFLDMKKNILFLLLFFSMKLFPQTDFDLVKMFNINGNVYTHEKIWLKNNTFLVPINFNTQSYTLENGVVVQNPNYQPGAYKYKSLILYYNENAQLIDYYTLNSLGHEYLRDITVDDNGNLYLTLEVESGYQLDDETYFVNTTNNLQKHLLLKVTSTKTPNGNDLTREVSWKKRIEGNLVNPTLAFGSNNTVYIAARSLQNDLIVDGISYSNPTPHQTQSSLTRMIVGKLNMNAPGMDWLTSSTNSVSETFGSIYIFNNRQHVIRVDSQNNIYLLGTLYGMKATFGNTTLNNIDINKEKLFMVKYSPTGQVLWAKSPTISNTSLYLVPTQFEIDQNNNLFLLEQYHPGHDGNQTVNYWGYSYTTGKSISTLIKFDTNGNVIWAKKPNALDSNNSHSCSLEYFRIVNGKILAFGYFNGVFDYGNGILIDTNQDYKWVSFEFDRNEGAIDSCYTLDTSMGVNPFNYIGMDSQNRLWFVQKTATAGNFNYYIGSLNYNLGIGNNVQKLIYFRSAAVTLGSKEYDVPDFSIYPNPTQDWLNLNGKDLTNQNYQIYDMSTKIISYGKIENSQINVENLTTGMYILKIYDRNDSRKNKSLKFIKQ